MADIRDEDVGASYSFSDLVDIATFAQFLESFTKATGIANGLVDSDGEFLAQAGWCDACVLYHRAFPEIQRRCQESNQNLMQQLHEGEVVGGLCKNGLCDYATPLVIEGRHLATLFLGQVLHEPPDIEFFSEKAEQFGLDKDAYLEAIHTVPIVSHEQIEAYMATIVGMANILADNGLARIRETKLERDLDKSTEQHIQIKDLLEFSPVGISWTDIDGNIEYINHQFIEMFGYTQDELPDLETWLGKAYPDAKYRQSVVEPWRKQAWEAHERGEGSPVLESNITCKDGSERRIITRANWVGEKRLASFTDITVHWRSELRNHAYSAILEMVAKAAPLSNILDTIVRTIEAEAPASICSVLLLDREGTHLVTGAAPSLPAFYNEAIDGIEIGEGVGSCGTAAYRGERVVVEDIFNHKYWEPYTELARESGLAACWSEPIKASDGKVLGTFAIYHATPVKPTLEDIERISFAANMAAIAIENQNIRDALLRSEHEFRTLAENAPVNIARYDREGRLTYANSRLIASLQVPIDQLINRRIEDHPELPFAEIIQSTIDQTIDTGDECSFETLVPDGDDGPKTHWVNMVAERDNAEVITGVLAIGQDITEFKQLQQELERQAHFDYLTKLVNRRYFIELAESELLRIQRYGGELSLIMFDLDYFKRINDEYGHSIGDRVLSEVARFSRDVLRDVDIVGRIGGEEFVALLPQTDMTQAAEVAERLRNVIAGNVLTLEDGKPLQFTASFGVAAVSSIQEQGKSLSIDDLLIRADDAMYQAKADGRNRVCLSEAL